jgi:hypothetical protein
MLLFTDGTYEGHSSEEASFKVAYLVRSTEEHLGIRTVINLG